MYSEVAGSLSGETQTEHQQEIVLSINYTAERGYRNAQSQYTNNAMHCVRTLTSTVATLTKQAKIGAGKSSNHSTMGTSVTLWQPYQ